MNNPRPSIFSTDTPRISRRGSNSIFAVVGIIIIFSLVFGYMWTETFDDYKPIRDAPELESSSWITTRITSANGYFRNSFSLPAQPGSAYIVVSGTEKFAVYINGEIAGTAAFARVRPSRIISINRHLRPGKNLVAIQVTGNSRDTAASVAARIEIEFKDGTHKTVKTDTTWRASRFGQFQRSNRALWSDVQFSDFEWPYAKIVSLDGARPIIHTGAPEVIYNSFLDWRSITFPNDNKASRTFAREFEIDGRYVSDAWLGVATDGQYSVSLNGVSLYGKSPVGDSMDVLDVGPYLRLGSNEIVINVQSDAPIARLTTNFMAASDTGVLYFGSDKYWRQLNETDMLSNAIDPIRFVQLIPAISDSSHSLLINKIDTPTIIASQYLLRLILNALVILFTIMAGMAILVAIVDQSVRRLFSGIPVLPFIWGTVVTGVLLILRFDTRFDINAPFQPIFIWLIAGGVAFWMLMTLFERRVIRNRLTPMIEL